MTNLKRLDPVMVFLSLVAIIGLASPLSFFLDLGSPFGGFLGVVNPENRGIAVDGSTPPWWSGVGPGLLQTGDILLTINGKAYEYHSIRDAYLAVYRTGNFQAELSFLRGEQILSRSVPLKLFNFEDFYDIVIPDLLNNLCFWLVAFGVFRAKPKEPINRAFAIAAGLVALSQSVVHPSLFVQSTAFARFAVLLWSLISPFVGLSIFYFASVFPFPIRNVYVNRVLKILGLMCVVVSLLFGLSRLLLWFWGYSDFIANVDTLSFRFAMFLLPGGMAFFVLTATFGAIQSQKFRRQLPLLLFGFCIAFLNVLPSVLNSLTPLTLYLVGLDTRPVLVVVPFVFALNILRYKAFRISDPYLIFALMISLSAFLSNVYAWFLWKFPLAGVLERPPFALLLVLVLSLNLFWALQTTLRGFLVKVFNWEGMSLSLVQQYGNRFSGASDFNLLPGMMAQALTEDLKIDLFFSILFFKFSEF